MMGKVGFIDLTSRDSGSIYVFQSSRGKYEFERTIGYDAGGASQHRGVDGINDFFLSLPVNLLNFRVIRLPFSDKEKVLKVLPFELEGLMMDSPDNVVFDAMVLGGSADQFDILVAYVEKGVLQGILGRLGQLQIDPQVVTCIELKAVSKEGAADIAARLVASERPDEEERIRISGTELLNETINLRRGPLAFTRDVEKAKRRLRATTALLLLLLLLIDSYLVFRIVTSKGETAAVKREIRNTYSALFPGDRKITDEVYQMKSHMREIRERGDAMIGVHPLEFLLNASERTIAGVSMNEVGLDKDVTTIKGEASSMEDIDKMKSRLAGFLTDVSVSDIKQISAGKLFFTVTAKGRK